VKACPVCNVVLQSLVGRSISFIGDRKRAGEKERERERKRENCVAGFF